MIRDKRRVLALIGYAILWLAPPSLAQTPPKPPTPPTPPKPPTQTGDPMPSWAIPEGYTYSCWVNCWRKNNNDRSPDIFAIESNHYGLTMDVDDLRHIKLGRLDHADTYESAIRLRAGRLADLPKAELSIEIEVDGKPYRANTCLAGLSEDVKRLSKVRLWESGRFVQHYDFLGLDFRDTAGEALQCDARLDLVAWPGSLTFTLIASDVEATSSSIMRLGMKSAVGEWKQERTIATPWKNGEEQSVSMNCTLATNKLPADAIVTVQSSGGSQLAVRTDPSNCNVATARHLRRSWKTGYTDIRNYDEFEISVSGTASEESIPFLLQLQPPANVTGVCPILCDELGRPTGIPIQLSKNWHYEPTGSYVMAYAMLPAKHPAKFRLRFAYGFYGTLPSASHAQLSLVGYAKSGGNGRWDQLAIGCWGESICFDMDMSLVDVAITDIRMLMTRSGIDGKRWNWTDAGWGGDWLNIQDSTQKKYFQNQLKTAYLAHGPCLTDVRHEGCYGANQEVDFTAEIQTLRTDDYCRTFQKLRYTFARDVTAKNIWLFKLGRTHSYQTPRIAYGNAEGLQSEDDVPVTLRKGDVFLDDVELAGPGPHWIAFPGASETSARKPKPNGYRAIVIRKFKAVIGDKTYTQPVLRSPVHAANPPNLDLELVPPAGIRQFRKGDQIEMDLELITLPRV
ncbi:MAG: hypothetical protein ACR2NZ_23110, partial [Rubripirellula sp.]